MVCFELRWRVVDGLRFRVVMLVGAIAVLIVGICVVVLRIKLFFWGLLLLVCLLLIGAVSGVCGYLDSCLVIGLRWGLLIVV